VFQNGTLLTFDHDVKKAFFECMLERINVNSSQITVEINNRNDTAAPWIQVADDPPLEKDIT
jgi:hypothetical protein